MTEAHDHQDSKDAFHRTTSNSFITSSQYTLLETPPTQNDRNVLEALKKYILHGNKEEASAGEGKKTVLPSLIDPFLSTVKDRRVLEDIHRYVWNMVMKRFGVMEGQAIGRQSRAAPSKMPKKVSIQLDNTLKRMRDPKDNVPLRSSEAIEIHLVWNLVRVLSPVSSRNAESMASMISSWRTLHGLLESCAGFIREEAERIVNPVMEKRLEKMWEFLMGHEYLLRRQSSRHGGSSVTLYDSQKRLLDLVMTRPNGVLVELATPPNTGKTLLAAGLALAKPRHRIVFCCIVPGVFLHVARLWYSLGFYPTFVYGNRRVEPSFKLSRVSWEASSPQPLSEYFRKVIPNARCFIVDLNLCRWFLDQLDPNTTVLMMDEPTIGLDGCEAFSHAPALVARVFASSSLPSTVIVSSATLPTTQQLLPLTAMWRKRYPSCPVERLDDPILTSSISLIEASTGVMVLPHRYCKTVEDLRGILDTMEKDVLYLRTYSGPAVVAMRKAFRAVYGKAPPSFAEAGLTWDRLDVHEIRKYAKYLLGAVCGDFRPEFLEWRGDPDFPPAEVGKIVLEFSPYVPGQTLVATKDTTALAQEMVRPLIAERSMRQLEQAIRQEELADKAFEELASKIKDPEERLEFQQSKEWKASRQYVPEELTIHTPEHIRRYGGRLSDFPKEFLRRTPPPSTLRKVMDLPCAEWTKHSFLAGLVYTDLKFCTDASSNVTVMVDQALADAVPVVCCGMEFTYGINSPASSVILTEEFSRAASWNTLLQYISRVNRVGSRSHNGRAFLCKTAMEKLLGRGVDTSEADALRLACEKMREA